MQRKRVLWSGRWWKEKSGSSLARMWHQLCPQLSRSSAFFSILIWRAGWHGEVTPLSWCCQWGLVAPHWCCSPRKGAGSACGSALGTPELPTANHLQVIRKALCALLLKLSLWIIYYLLVSWINYTYKWRQKNYNKCCFWLWQTGMCESLIKYLTDCSI